MSKKPNVILLFCDQMRGDAMGADGNQIIQTPNFDYLAAKGTLFKHAYTASPSCIPARSILMTGLNQWHAGPLGMGRGQGHMPNDYPHTLAGTFAENGYRTHLVGKGHFHPQRSEMGFQSAELDESGRMPTSEHREWFKQNAPASVTPDDHGVGFNSWHARPWHSEEHLHPTAWTMTRSLDFMRTYDDSENPFFLNISFARPHSPYVPPSYYFEKYAHKNLPKPHLGDWSAMHDDPETAKNPSAWRGKMSDEAIHNARAGYYGSINFIDSQIGRLIQYLETSGKAENTWILFSADHGDMQGDHNLWRKTYAYEGSARIPFIICPPLKGQTAVARHEAQEVVELRDVMPTLLDIAGLKGPDYMDGKSLLPLMQAPDAEFRTYIHGEHCLCYHEDQEMQYVTNGKRKFIWLPCIGIEQFFDLEADPGECHNLIEDASRQSEIQTWRQYLIDELAGRDCGWVKDGKLHYPGEALVSPYLTERYTG